MSTVLTLQHVHCETLGTIADALQSAGVRAEYVRPFEGEPVPGTVGDAAGLVVMGGPMGVYDHPTYPFLLDEMRLIEQAIREGKPVLGVCLGSQLIAAALGATVRKGRRKEIGWHTVTLTGDGAADPLWTGIESPFVAFHWHGDVFDLPKGAVSLASSDLTECQAYRYGGKVYGFLFHMEVTDGLIQGMAGTFADELREEGIDGRELVGQAKGYLPRLRSIGGQVFRRWAGLL